MSTAQATRNMGRAQGLELARVANLPRPPLRIPRSTAGGPSARTAVRTASAAVSKASREARVQAVRRSMWHCTVHYSGRRCSCVRALVTCAMSFGLGVRRLVGL